MNRSLSRHEIDGCDAMALAIDRAGRLIDEKWGTGRLPSLAGVEMAARLERQCQKFRAALDQYDYSEVLKHGGALERAYAELDAAALAGGHSPQPSDQWEFVGPDGDLIILVKDIRQVGLVDTHGRKAQVWSLDEIASVIRAHPVLASAKAVFPGAEIVSIRPVVKWREALAEENNGLPF